MRITRAEIERRIDNAIQEYAEITGRRYDPTNGWAQIPRGPKMIEMAGLGEQRREFVAAIKYGEIDALERLLDN